MQCYDFVQGNILEVAKSDERRVALKKLHSNAKFEQHAIKQVLDLNMQDANAHDRPISLWGNEVWLWGNHILFPRPVAQTAGVLFATVVRSGSVGQKL